MKSFKDINGKDWRLSINVNSLKRARELADFDLLKIAEDRATISRLSEDPILLVSVLYAVCLPEAEEASITAEQFGEALASGDVIEAATVALLTDLIGFFPKHRRQVLVKALEKLDQFRSKAAELAVLRLDSPELESQVIDLISRQINQPLQAVGS